MAHVLPNPKPQDPKAYNVDLAVGSLAPNGAGDVKLVQYMLKHFYGQQALNLKVDGFIGPTTLSFIKKFQEDSKKAGANVLVDSRIDRARGQISSISKTVYAILLLNRALRERNPAAHAAVPQHVPINAAPTSNPYGSGKPKKVVLVTVYGAKPPYDVFIHYHDQSVVHQVVQGAVIYTDGTLVHRFPFKY